MGSCNENCSIPFFIKHTNDIDLLANHTVSSTLSSTIEINRGLSDDDLLVTLLASKTYESLLLEIMRRLPREKTRISEVKNIVSILICQIDSIMTAQVNTIIHHRRFQKMESSWLSLYYLCQQAEDKDGIKVKVLDVSLKELARDFDKAIEFDQSQIFKKVYSNEYDTAGGEPFGVLLGNYSFSHKNSNYPMVDSLSVLTELSHVAAAAFTPFISSVSPSLFGLNDFSGLTQQIDFELSFSQPEYSKWRTFRQNIDSRFVGLVLPRILIRRAYGSDVSRNDGFGYIDESIESRESYLWANSSFAFASVLMRAFDKNGWFADIRGSSQGINEGGVVPGLITDFFHTDSKNTALKFSTDVVISDNKEKLLGDLGFIPLCHSRGTEYSVFYGNQSAKGISENISKEEKLNDKLSSMLQYIFCVSRFAHYLKVIGRDKIGSFSDAIECEHYLQKWIMGYTVSSQTGSYEMRARYPLSECSVEVREIAGKPGIFGCVVNLKPHMQLDQIMSSIKLVTQLGATSA